MALDPDNSIAGESAHAPRMLEQPSEARPSLGRVGDTEPVRSVRQTWMSRHTSHTSPLGRRLRAWAGRVSGRADRRLLFAIAHATDAIAAHCDLIADRLESQETITGDVTHAFGEEISRLRSEVIHLQRVVGSAHPPA
jgi:hypothetical protein